MLITHKRESIFHTPRQTIGPLCEYFQEYGFDLFDEYLNSGAMYASGLTFIIDTGAFITAGLTMPLTLEYP